MKQYAPVVGELFRLNPGYTSGVWLRGSVTSWVTGEDGHVGPDEVVIVLELESPVSKDPSVLILSSTGKLGWTFASRLGDPL